jgi:hypothetical protein
MIVSGKKKMICIEVNDEEEEEVEEEGGGGGGGTAMEKMRSSKVIELRGPRARSMYQSARVQYIVSSYHHRSIHKLHMVNSSFSATVRMAQRWIHSMMLSFAYTIESIELLVASLYCEPTCRP